MIVDTGNNTLAAEKASKCRAREVSGMRRKSFTVNRLMTYSKVDLDINNDLNVNLNKKRNLSTFTVRNLRKTSAYRFHPNLDYLV